MPHDTLFIFCGAEHVVYVIPVCVVDTMKKNRGSMVTTASVLQIRMNEGCPPIERNAECVTKIKVPVVKHF